MRVTLLGTGTALPAPDRGPAAALVEGDGTRLLVDAGPGVARRAEQTGCGVARLDGVLLTHLHPDHCAGLVELLFALRQPALADRAPFRIVGPAGTTALVTALRAAWPRWLEPRGPDVTALDIGPGPFVVGRIAGEAHAVPHTGASYAYRLSVPGGAVVALSGDAVDSPGLRAAARRAGLFVCEATFPAGAVHGAHLSAREAAGIARACGVARLVLTHLGPGQDASDPLAEARAEFAGPVAVGRDLDAFVAPPPS